MAVSLGLSITQNSQSIANNTSNITVSVIAYWTSGSWNGTAKPGTLAIDGTTYDFSSSFNTGHSTTGSQTIYTKTVDVSHSTDGTKTVACSASFITGVSSGTVYTSASKTLTTIPRKSSLTVSNGTLGTELTLTINRHSSTFSHRIKYSCGTESEYLTTDAIDGTSVTWTPPISLAAQNTSSTAVSIAFTLYTYDENGVELGTDTAAITCAIPSSVVPTVSIAATDASGYLATYDGYIQNLSKISVTITAAGVYGSTIKAYNTSADGKTYTTSSFTTDPISGSGELTITATVSDTRGRTATASTTITVIAYSAPKITAIDIYRSGASGTATSNGAYLTVKFSGSVTSINSKNTAKYVVQYKKANDASYTSEELADYANAYSVIDGMYTFAADTSSTYDIIFTATDAFNSAQRSGSGGTVSKLFSFLSKGLGIAFGKVAEKNKTVELEDEWSLEVGKNATIGGNASVSGTFGVTGESTLKNTTVDGTLTTKDSIYMPNSKDIYMQNASGTGRNVLHLNGSNSLNIGYGGYSESEGRTIVYGNEVQIITKNGLKIDGSKAMSAKLLWSGSWSSGSITVANIQDYKLTLVQTTDGDLAICWIDFGLLLGGELYPLTDDYGQMIYCIRASVGSSGNTLTMENSYSILHSLNGGHGGKYIRTVKAIYGIVYNDDSIGV